MIVVDRRSDDADEPPPGGLGIGIAGDRDTRGQLHLEWVSTGGQDRSLWGSGVVLPKYLVLTEDSGLQERLHQVQHGFVPDAFPHPAHETGMRDFVEVFANSVA